MQIRNTDQKIAEEATKNRLKNGQSNEKKKYRYAFDFPYLVRYRIMEVDSLKDAALVLVVDGCFSVSQVGEDGREREIHLCYPGGLLGQLQARVIMSPGWRIRIGSDPDLFSPDPDPTLAMQSIINKGKNLKKWSFDIF